MFSNHMGYSINNLKPYTVMKNSFFTSAFLLISFAIFSQEITSQQLEYLRNNPEILENLNDDDFGKFESEIVGDDSSLDIEAKDIESEIIEESEIFGFDFITKIPQSISSTSDLPVPNDYLLSLGDELKIILTGSKREVFNLTIGLDGTILFPELGSISVFGESIKEVRNKIKNLIDLSYVGTEVSISIEKLAARKINIIGAIKNPGTYIVNPFSTITSSLGYSGGFEDYSSLRNIKLIRNGKEISFDLYDLLIYGNRAKDINIQAGDTIKIEGSNNFVSIEGEVIRPYIYEYSPTDKFEDLVGFALGLASDADKNNIYVTEITNGLRRTKKINLSDRVGDTYLEKLHVGTNVYVSQKNVFVDGFGVSKGFVSSDITEFKELISGLQFSSDIYPFYAIYEFETLEGLSRTKLAFSLADPDTYKDFQLHRNSTIYFFDRDFVLRLSDFTANSTDEEEIDFEDDDNYLLDAPIASEFVQYKSPNLDLSLPIKGRITPKILHEYFGINEKISFENVGVITNIESFSDAYTQIYDADSIVAITLPKVEADLITVSISGQILNPGTYRLSASTSLNELYVLAGGFLENAFQEGIFFSREAVKENQQQAIIESRTILVDSLLQKSTTNERAIGDINAIIALADNLEPTGRITGNFYPDTEFSKTFILSDGDNIFIPTKRDEITVQGEVLNSTSFLYDKDMSLIDYVNAAGGYSSYADKQAVFVVRADGTATKIDRNIFSGNDIDIQKGDTIVVPRNLDQIEGLPLVQAATNIISNIAFSAASLNALRD